MPAHSEYVNMLIISRSLFVAETDHPRDPESPVHSVPCMQLRKPSCQYCTSTLYLAALQVKQGRKLLPHLVPVLYLQSRTPTDSQSIIHARSCSLKTQKAHPRFDSLLLLLLRLLHPCCWTCTLVRCTKYLGMKHDPINQSIKKQAPIY